MIENINLKNRLNNMIMSDNNKSLTGLDKLIKSEIVNVLKNYFNLSTDDVGVEFVANCQDYILNITAKVKGVKKIKKII